MSQPQAVLLTAQLPAHLLEFLASYVVLVGDSHILYSFCFDPQGIHVGLDLIRNDNSKERLKVRIQIQFVLATAALSEDDIKRVGFLS